jgi:soluble lytic murein transglycosylase
MQKRRFHSPALPVIALATLVVWACSSTSKKPAVVAAPAGVPAAVPFPFPPTERAPAAETSDATVLDQELEQRLKIQPGEAMRLFVRYRQAQLWKVSDPGKSCDRWLEASSNPTFPLKDVARLHALETCPAEKSVQLNPQDTSLTGANAWMRENMLRATLARAERTNDRAAQKQLLIDLSRFDRLQSDKVKKLEKALELAKALGENDAAETIATSLRAVAPRYDTNPKAENYLPVANDFRLTRQFAKAREWYTKAFASPELDVTERLRALDGIRISYKLEKDTPNHLKATKDFSDYAHKELLNKSRGRLTAEKRALLTRYVETQITLARAVWTEGSSKQANEIMLKTEHDIRGRVSTASSSLLRARIAEEVGNFDEAVNILAAVPEKAISTRDLQAKILWYRSWDLRKLQRYPEAIEIFQRLVQIEESPTLLSRDHFWLARTFAQTAQADKAKVEFEWLIENDPLGYYGLLSHRELKRPLAVIGAKDPTIVEPPPLDAHGLERVPAGAQEALNTDEKLIFEWLMAVNENDLGRRFLDQVNSNRRGFSEDQRFDLLLLYARTGQFQSLFSRVSELPAPTKRKLIESRPELYFPRPWRTIVENSAIKFKVPSELIYSIMRQESSFNPGARSPADAFGLMQLIPENAKIAGKRADIEIGQHEDLYRPEVNIPLGTAFLRELMDHWKDKFIPTVASYNASDKAIAGWLKTRFHGDVLEFIEDVPYDETKTYLKLVMRNFVFYSRLNNGSANQALDLPFPEWCLANLQDIKP